MPLPYPCAYLITYDLKGIPFQYNRFFGELKKSEKWFHYIDTTWIVLRRDALDELQNILVPLVLQEDRLLIMPAKGPAMGWLPKDAWDWIDANVPKAW